MATATKKLTILVDADMHRALLKKVGRGNIGRFLINAAKPHLAGDTHIRAGYAAMAADRAREEDANEWSENLITDSYVAPEK
ncbi:addiction module antitoxin [Candidatus Kaiserbacteria bacterium]|nr:addiction module antitoxin [Candidatus Kaiserbacteria bacterium]